MEKVILNVLMGNLETFFSHPMGIKERGLEKQTKKNLSSSNLGTTFMVVQVKKTNKRIAEANRQEQTQGKKESTFRKEHTPQSGTGSGFFTKG
jgi:hypothetical protein